jgi:hypothetical protein
VPDSIEQYWKISGQDVKNLEENFKKIYALAATGCCVSGPRIAQLKKFGFQYLGVMIRGRKYIYINAFPIEEVRRYRDSGHDPSQEPVTVCDGGTGFWGALFDMDAKEFSSLSFNGVG